MARTGSHPGTKLLLLADEARRDRSKARPFDLWLLADREAADKPALRRDLYRHALIHAGYLDPKAVYCSVCDALLI